MKTRKSLVFSLMVTGLAAGSVSAQLPDWTRAIRTDHPRLFFNADTWDSVRERALGTEKERFDRLVKDCDRIAAFLAKKPEKLEDLGVYAAKAAFAYRVTGEEARRKLTVDTLTMALDFYAQRFEEKRSVNWYSTSRLHAIMAWDWICADLPQPQRAQLLERLVDAVDRVLQARPRIHRENYSNYTTGFYGIRNCCWFLGCTGYGMGVREDKINEWLVWGYDENQRLLKHRRRACGDDGGSASPTLGYAFGAYPWAEQNFLYTWLSATDENIAPDWPHSAWLANYVIWNWVPGTDAPLEFGYGDTPHTTNRLPIHQLYSHMANVRHLFGKQLPEAASLARRVQDMLPERNRRHSNTWFIYPFLLAGAETDGPPLDLSRLPNARHFDAMGQIFMRSGTNVEDTYALFTCGGVLAQHRQYDALNLVIVHRGAHLALDSGTRYREQENGQHLANYFAQTVAHNCVLIHQPGEPPARYWGGKVEANHGGQHKQLGSKVVAFETHDDFVYVAGDAKECYQHQAPKDHKGHPLPQKCTEATRQVVFILPDTFVVFDRVTATVPGYRKQWLLHTAHEPVIDGTTARADHLGARLFCRTVLPDNPTITIVGGPEKAFWAAGTNWAINDKGLKPEQKAMMGQWRLEIDPPQPRKQDVFLHVLKVGPDSLEAMPGTPLVQDADHATVRVQVGNLLWTVSFAKEGPLAGAVRAEAANGQKALDQPFTIRVTPQAGIVPEGR